MVKEEKVYWQLFKNIFIISACTFGGGFVIVGMIKEKFAEKLHWISEEEILDMAAIAQSAPGPLGVNMAVITGYRIRKVPGAFLSFYFSVLLTPRHNALSNTPRPKRP